MSDSDEVLGKALRRFERLDADGRETLDPRPKEIPAGFKRPESLAETVQRLTRGAIARHASEQGYESFEEAEDFEVDDDIDPLTPYEAEFDPVLGRDITPEEFRRNPDYYRKKYLEMQDARFRQIDLEEALARQSGRRSERSSRTPSGEDRGGAGQGAGAAAGPEGRSTGPLKGDGGGTPSS